jgi:gas vesicle protein
MNRNMKLTIENWKSELKRLKYKYDQTEDKARSEARGFLDHIKAVEEIIADIEKQAK